MCTETTCMLFQEETIQPVAQKVSESTKQFLLQRMPFRGSILTCRVLKVALPGVFFFFVYPPPKKKTQKLLGLPWWFPFAANKNGGAHFWGGLCEASAASPGTRSPEVANRASGAARRTPRRAEFVLQLGGGFPPMFFGAFCQGS